MMYTTGCINQLLRFQDDKFIYKKGYLIVYNMITYFYNSVNNTTISRTAENL